MAISMPILIVGVFPDMGDIRYPYGSSSGYIYTPMGLCSISGSMGTLMKYDSSRAGRLGSIVLLMGKRPR
jgi:hypothetical protein